MTEPFDTPLCFTAKRWATIDREIQAVIQIEYRIISSLVDELLAQDLTISINDGEVTTIRRSTDRTVILSNIMCTDEEHMIVHHKTQYLGSIFLVYGNEGWDVINDYTVALEPSIQQTLSMIEGLAQ